MPVVLEHTSQQKRRWVPWVLWLLLALTAPLLTAVAAGGYVAVAHPTGHFENPYLEIRAFTANSVTKRRLDRMWNPGNPTYQYRDGWYVFWICLRAER
jgi:hypothetical protein